MESKESKWKEFVKPSFKETLAICVLVGLEEIKIKTLFASKVLMVCLVSMNKIKWFVNAKLMISFYQVLFHIIHWQILLSYKIQILKLNVIDIHQLAQYLMAPLMKRKYLNQNGLLMLVKLQMILSAIKLIPKLVILLF